MASTITSESLRVISTTRETSSINSALVIVFVPVCLPAFPFSSQVHNFLYSHCGSSGLPLVILQPRLFLVLGHRPQTQPDLLVAFIHFNDLEIVFVADRQGRIPSLSPIRHGRNLRLVAQR